MSSNSPFIHSIRPLVEQIHAQASQRSHCVQVVLAMDNNPDFTHRGEIVSLHGEYRELVLSVAALMLIDSDLNHLLIEAVQMVAVLQNQKNRQC